MNGKQRKTRPATHPLEPNISARNRDPPLSLSHSTRHRRPRLLVIFKASRVGSPEQCKQDTAPAAGRAGGEQTQNRTIRRGRVRFCVPPQAGGAPSSRDVRRGALLATHTLGLRE